MGTKATPLLPTFEKRVSDAVEKLIADHVTPWSAMEAGQPFRVMRFDGREISYQGITYEGSPQEVFWSRYIEPFLEAMVDKELGEAVKTCRTRRVDTRQALPELRGILLSGLKRVYAQMADVDRRLQGHGDPSTVHLRSTEHEQHLIEAYLQRRIDAELEIWRRGFLSRWFEDNKFWRWVIAGLFGIAGWAIHMACPKTQAAAASPRLEAPASVEPKSEILPPVKVDSKPTRFDDHKAGAATSGIRPLTPDPLRAAIDRYIDFNAAHPEVDIGVEQIDDPMYMGIWRVKMSMLDNIQDLAQSLHREKEVESLLSQRSMVSINSDTGPLKFGK